MRPSRCAGLLLVLLPAAALLTACFQTRVYAQGRSYGGFAESDEPGREKGGEQTDAWPPDAGMEAGAVARTLRPPPSPERAAMRASDRTGPEIVHAPVEHAAAGAPLALEARIHDLSGVAEAWVQYSWDMQPYRECRLRLDPDGAYRAVLPAPPVQAQRLDYTLGATDYRGTTSSSPGGDRLFHVELFSPLPVAKARRSTAAGVMKAVLPGMFVMILFTAFTWTRTRRARAPARLSAVDADRLFWKEILGPLKDLPGRTMNLELEKISRKTLAHPILGPRQFPAAYLKIKLDVLRFKS